MNADEGSRCMAIALEKLSRAQSAIGFGFVFKIRQESGQVERVVSVGGGEGGARNRSEETVRVVVRRRGSESERGERAKNGARNVADEKRIRQRDGRTRKV